MSSSTASPGLFTRRATGLVREGRTRDALFYNLLWSSVGLTFAFFWLFAGFYPGASALLAFLIAAALGLPGAFLYAMLTQLMPRTGGDYVFNSRSLHPSIGFAGNFSYSVWLAIVIGVYSTYIAAYGFGAFGRMMAGFGAGDGWLSFGDWFGTRAGLFITGTAVLCLSAAIFAFGGVRLFFKIQIVAFSLYLLGAIVVPVLVGLFTSNATFVSNFNEYAAHFGVQDAAGKLAASATELGFAPAEFSFEMTLRAVSVFWFIFGFIFSSNYFAGEIRLAKRTHMYSMPGAVGLAVLVLLCMVPTFTHVVGYDYAAMFSLADPTAYGFGLGPAYPELIGIAAGSPVIGAIAIIGFTIALLTWLPQTLMLVSRNMFAWSFDNVMPAKLSQVDARTRSPLIAIGVMLVLSIGSTAIYSFTDWFSSIAALLGLTFPLLVTAIAGTLLPFRHPDLVASSPYSGKVLGIPVLTAVGSLAILGFGGAIAILLWDPASGVSLSENGGKIFLVAGIYLAGIAIWWISRAIRKRQGIDVDLAYRELPAA
ncbi:APC family permease [Conexibacter arvalis]|uniref:Amino acid transporter n=1 Tax=Conexibacter arvalis TaxID=912552 RepID=A0A840IGI3_9ACTN|nr:amino acid permease [Conexibacter arvalis]MBB4663303.1 amino acid transporter [Conexibacter arvalis]